MKIALIILAAGNSSRLGQPKQMLDRGNQSMIQYIYNECIKSKLGPVYVVTGAYHDAIAKELTEATLIRNSKWQNGMASTISFALRNIDQENLEGTIIVLSDQIYLTSETLTQLGIVASTHTNKIVNCQYQKGMGPPTYFHKSLFSELELLSGDDGAKSIVKKYFSCRFSIDFPLGDLDLDTLDDLKRLEDL